jgi:hypothetical protein
MLIPITGTDGGAGGRTYRSRRTTAPVAAAALLLLAPAGFAAYLFVTSGPVRMGGYALLGPRCTGTVVVGPPGAGTLIGAVLWVDSSTSGFTLGYGGIGSRKIVAREMPTGARLRIIRGSHVWNWGRLALVGP